MQQTGRKKLVELNPHLTCMLCGGYFVDATTIIECLHSFCKTCIVRYLSLHKICPVCDVQVHKTRPLVNIRSDQTLQDIVYKLVPGLFKSEMRKRREFYARLPPSARGCIPTSSEERGDARGVERLIFTPEDLFSLSLEYSARDVLPIRPPLLGVHSEEEQNSPPSSRRYLSCPGAFTVGHLKKFLRAKYGLASNQEVDVMYVHDYLLDEYTLIDLAYIYSWRRNAPMRLLYRFPNLHVPSPDAPVPAEEGKSIVIATKPSDSPVEKSSCQTATLNHTDPPKKDVSVIPLPPPPSSLQKQQMLLCTPPKVSKLSLNYSKRNGVLTSPNGVRTNFRLILPATNNGGDRTETQQPNTVKQVNRTVSGTQNGTRQEAELCANEGPKMKLTSSTTQKDQCKETTS
uniref:RING-type domain-containing protein n=1 Tax=Ornithodoros turicata TaxID=34597 RepID=A0A2R5LL05_9ACAR